MAAKGFILTMLAVAAAGVIAGLGASALFPASAGEAPPAATPPASTPPAGNGPGAGGGAPPGGRALTEEDLPPELREAMAQDPQLAAEVRAAIESGELVLPGAPPAAPGAGAGGTGRRRGEPLTGAVASFEDGTLRLDTPDGETSIAVAPDAPVSLTTTAAEAGNALAAGSEVVVVARPNESGALEAESILAGAVGPSANAQQGFGGSATVVAGSVASFAGGTLTVATADGDVAVIVADETPTQVAATAETTAELTAGATITAFVQRGADGRLEAVSIIVGG